MQEQFNLNQIIWSDYSILLAEDNKVNQFVVQSFIEGWGAKLTICEDGLKTIKELEKGSFDVILMDIQMPVMDGIECTKRIRSKLKSSIPIVGLTANAVKGDKEYFLSIGMDDYVSKPFNENTLKQVIANLLTNTLTKKDPMNKMKIMDISSLKRMGNGKESFVLKMLQIFLEESYEQIPELEGTKDTNIISSLAHKIKPSIDFIANDQMKKAVREIENKDFIEDPKLLSNFISNWKLLLREIEEHIPN